MACGLHIYREDDGGPDRVGAAFISLIFAIISSVLRVAGHSPKLLINGPRETSGDDR